MEIVTHMMRYRRYIQGITVSGGEALLQPNFVAEIFKAAHARGLNTCIDTTGQSPKQYWDLVLPHTDTALVCIKHTDPEKYRQFAGVPQRTALEFVDVLAHQYAIPFVFRYLYIPTFSDSDADVDAFLAYAEQYRERLRGIELLPYHRLGVEKWKAAGIPYPLDGVPLPDHAEVERTRRRMEARGVAVSL
jgi:pyruvate formate lyase activating enzyme